MTTVVLGGGLSGLAAAHYLIKKHPKKTVTLIESSSRTGGWIKSFLQTNGTVLEQGPRTIRPKGEAGLNTLELVEELGLSDQIVPIVSSHPAAKNRMIYANGALHLLPSSLMGLFKKQDLFSKPLVMHLLKDLTAQTKKVEDESIYEFVERRFGNEVADYLISPLICGICAGNAQEISVKFLMKGLFEYEQKYGSISMGALRNIFIKTGNKASGLGLQAKTEKWAIYSFVKGCESLPIALQKTIESSGIQIKLNTSCKSLTFQNNQVVVETNDGPISTNHVISALPAHTLGNLLPQHPDLSSSLKNLAKNVSVAVVNLQYQNNFIQNPAFGLLVTPKEKRPALGIIYDSCCFPKDSCGTALTVMLGGHWFQEHFGSNPTEQLLLDVASTEVKQILQIDENPCSYKVNVLHQCLPQYVVGHSNYLNCINSYIERNQLPISLCGASYYGVGINDVILSAKKAVDELR